MIQAFLFGFFGGILGFMIPVIAQKFSFYKCNKIGTEFVLNMWYMRLFVRVAISLLNAVIWAFAGYKMDNVLIAVFISILFTIAILIAIIDLLIKIIPNELVLIMAIAGTAFQILYFGIESLFNAFLFMIVLMALFIIISGIIGFGKVGAGDVKLVGAMGLALGYPNIIIALIVMSASLLIYSLIGLILKKLTLHSMFPFAPFMMLGMMV